MMMFNCLTSVYRTPLSSQCYLRDDLLSILETSKVHTSMDALANFLKRKTPFPKYKLTYIVNFNRIVPFSFVVCQDHV